MGDGSVRSDIQPFPADSPPTYEGEPRTGVGTAGNEMRLYCIHRRDGAINILFMDWTVRAVGLKELWTLQWHCHFDVTGPWTRAGGAAPTDWPPWMRAFRDY